MIMVGVEVVAVDVDMGAEVSVVKMMAREEKK